MLQPTELAAFEIEIGTTATLANLETYLKEPDESVVVPEIDGSLQAIVALLVDAVVPFEDFDEKKAAAKRSAAVVALANPVAVECAYLDLLYVEVETVAYSTVAASHCGCIRKTLRAAFRLAHFRLTFQCYSSGSRFQVGGRIAQVPTVAGTLAFPVAAEAIPAAVLPFLGSCCEMFGENEGRSSFPPLKRPCHLVGDPKSTSYQHSAAKSVSLTTAIVSFGSSIQAPLEDSVSS